MDVQLKTCSICKTPKATTDFHNRPDHSFGVSCWCKSCESNYNKARYISKKEKITAVKKAYYIKNYDSIYAKRKQYVLSNKPYVDSWQKEYREQHSKERKAYSKKYYMENKDGLFKKYRLLYKYNISLEQYNLLIDSQGGSCKICLTPLKDVRRIHIDHDHLCCQSPKTCGKCIRGILCSRCNRTLSLIYDNSITALRCSLYLNGSLSSAQEVLNNKSDVLKTIGEIK